MEKKEIKKHPRRSSVPQVSHEIELMLPTMWHRWQVEEYAQKFKDHPSGVVGVNIHGCGSLGKISFNDWIQECDDHRVGKNLPTGYVPATQYIAIRKTDHKLVGMFQIRHSLTEFLERIGGHIGYSVAPDERRKGYATEMLRMGLELCKEIGMDRVRLSCVKPNIASAGVIEKCGGIYDGDAEHEGMVFKRYWINL